MNFFTTCSRPIAGLCQCAPPNQTAMFRKYRRPRTHGGDPAGSDLSSRPSPVRNLDRPLLVVSDTHFGPHTPPESSRDLARVIDAHPGAELILDGDVFDLSHAPRLDQSAEFLSALLDRAPELVRAFRKHVALSAPL